MTSQNLSLSSTTAEVKTALAAALNISPYSILVTSSTLRPAMGMSWSIRLYEVADINSIALTPVVPLSLNGDPSPTSLSLLEIDSGTLSDIHRLVIHSPTSMSGVFRMSYLGVFTKYMSIDVSAQLFEHHLSNAFFIDKVLALTLSISISNEVSLHIFLVDTNLSLTLTQIIILTLIKVRVRPHRFDLAVSPEYTGDYRAW